MLANEETIQKIKDCGKVILCEYPHNSKAHDFAILVVALCDMLSAEKAALDRSFPEVSDIYRRIDGIVSVSQIKGALLALDDITRRKVILHGLANSKLQNTWSFMAETFEVPKAEWPPNPNDAAEFRGLPEAVRNLLPKLQELKDRRKHKLRQPEQERSTIDDFAEAPIDLLLQTVAENKQLHEQVTRLQSLSNVQLLQSRGGQLGLILNEGEQWVPLTDDVLLSCAPKEAQQSLSDGVYPRTIEGLSSWRLSDLLKAGEVRPVDPLGCTKPMSQDEKQFRAILDSENANKLRVRFSVDTRHAFEKQLEFVNSAVYWSILCTATINHIKEYSPEVAELALRLLEERVKQALAGVRSRCLVAM